MAATIAPTTTCSNHVDDTPGLGLICRVTVVNRITATGGSARVTVTECHGAAGDPRASCLTRTTRADPPRHGSHAMQSRDQWRRWHAPVQRAGHESIFRDQPPYQRGHRRSMRRIGWWHHDWLRPVPGHHDQCHDHAVQRLRERRNAGGTSDAPRQAQGLPTGASRSTSAITRPMVAAPWSSARRTSRTGACRTPFPRLPLPSRPVPLPTASLPPPGPTALLRRATRRL